jgi:hypothetical protein
MRRREFIRLFSSTVVARSLTDGRHILVERRSPFCFHILKRWTFVAVAALLIGSVPTPGDTFIGTPVLGVCFAGCGSDSLLNRGASSIGSAFTDGAVQHFGDEGRQVVDYANGKAQERLQQLSAMLDDERKKTIQGIATQRQLFTSSLDTLVNTAAKNLQDVISGGLQKLQQLINDGIDQLDRTLRDNFGMLGVFLAIFAGFLFGLAVFVIYAFQKIVRRIKIAPSDWVRGGLFVLLGSFSGGLFAHIYNNVRETQLVKAFEEKIPASLAYYHIAEAAAIARRINFVSPSDTHDYTERKFAIVRDFLLGNVWDTGKLRSQTATVQAAHFLAYKQVDPDVMIISAYLESNANDALPMNDVIQKFLGNALLEPKTGNLGPYENELRTLGCDLYRTIEVANTRTQAHERLTKWINALGETPQKRKEYVSVAANRFGVAKTYADEVLSRERPTVPGCDFADQDFRVDPNRLSDGTTATDVSPLREIAVLQHALQVRRQVLVLDADAGFWLWQCLFSGTFEVCPGDTEDKQFPELNRQLEKRYAWLNSVIRGYFSRGVALTPPARLIATLQFLKWLKNNRFATGAEFGAMWYYDKNSKPLTLPIFLINDPNAKPTTLCSQYYPPQKALRLNLNAKIIKFRLK